MARLFIGLPVPQQVKEVIRSSTKNYPNYIDKQVPEGNWHITLVFVGEVSHHRRHLPYLGQPIPQTYTPIISVTHMGQGLQQQQLWAYVLPTLALTKIKQEIEARLRSLGESTWQQYQHQSFVPHIRVANLRNPPGRVPIPDVVASIRFAVRHINIYRTLSPPASDRSADQPGDVSYQIVGSIPLNS
jgi:2'-5' RNA ligase